MHALHDRDQAQRRERQKAIHYTEQRSEQIQQPDLEDAEALTAHHLAIQVPCQRPETVKLDHMRHSQPAIFREFAQ